MKILFVTSECAPFSKSGGLADVVGSLPKEIDRRYYDVRVILPKYACMAQEMKDTLNWPDLSRATYLEYFESTHTSGLEIYIQYKGGVYNPMAMWATTTDSTGKKNTGYAPTDWTQLSTQPCIAIY